MKHSLAFKCVAAALLIFLYAPIAVVVVNSFNASTRGQDWTGFTLHWHAALWNDPVVLRALQNTAILALVSTAISTVLGTGLGFAMARARGVFRPFIASLCCIPVIVPDILMAAALLLAFSLCHQFVASLGLGMLAMILAHVTFQLPFVGWIISAGVEALDPSVEHAARDLGASSWTTFRKITLPLLRPAVLGGALLAFTLSLDDFIISFFTSGPGTTTLPIYIYSSVKRGISPEVNALSTWIVLFSALAVTGFGFLRRAR